MDGDLHMVDVVLRRNETLFGSTRNNTITSDVYTRPEVNELLNEKADKTDLEGYYCKSETFAKDEVFNKTEADQFETFGRDEVYSKNKTDELLDEKVNEAILDDYYSKIETYAKTETYNQTEIDGFLDQKIDIGTSYTQREDEVMLLLKADKTDLIDSYAKTETDQKLELKANIFDLIDSYAKTDDDALLLLKADKTDLIDSCTKTEDDAMLLLKTDKTDLDNFVDLSSAQTISGQKQFEIVSVSGLSKLN
ncbi:MAG: hypothetical protein EZS28_049469, partial [Streblomastix strix]